MINKIIPFFIFSWFLACAVAQTKEPSSESPTFKMNGNALLTSHSIHRGISQTHSDPALQVQFSYNLGPQIEFGLWGSNVRYLNSDEHLNLKFFGGAKVDFSPNAQLNLRYILSRYFHNDQRNGSELGLKLNVFSYYIQLESPSNWNGTNSSSSHFAFGYNHKLGNSFLVDINAAFNQLTVVTYNSYFDIQAEITYISSETLNYTTGLTLNSESSQFNGDGDPFIYVRIKTLF